jgi:hypothetical protein
VSARSPLDPTVTETGWKRDRSHLTLAYERQLEDAGADHVAIWHQRKLTVIVAREPLGPNGALRWHLSISHPERYPSYDEIAAARYGLIPDRAYMVMILPPRSAYVNLHQHTMHLHEVPEAMDAANQIEMRDV